MYRVILKNKVHSFENYGEAVAFKCNFGGILYEKVATVYYIK